MILLDKAVPKKDGARPPLTLIFRKTLKKQDEDVVRMLTKDSGFFSAEEVEIAVELVTERLAKGPASGYHFVFVEDEYRVLGYSCYGPIPGTKSSFDLYWIVVDRKLRNQAIGKRLLAHTENLAREMKSTRMYVDTSSRMQYAPTRAFYKSCGYEEEAVLKNFYKPGEHKVIFAKRLDRGPAMVK
ncbi:MAG: GNAT family N-acetyltransferase [Thermodesulfobacteriota bacterium]